MSYLLKITQASGLYFVEDKQGKELVVLLSILAINSIAFVLYSSRNEYVKITSHVFY